MQAPGRPDEDQRGDFKYGGWATPYAAMNFATGESMSNTGPLLFGRRTYEDFYKVWPNQSDNPYTEVLNNAQKFVASTTLKEPLPWVNSTLLKGDAIEGIASLKSQPGKDFLVMGSGVLVQSLMKNNLVDIYVLLIHPLILGSGRRLFPDNSPYTSLELVDSKSTPTGVVIATYKPTTTV
jgi:dihydrofolate reductase